VQFNDAINAQDIVRLARLMTNDHRFIDTEGGIVSGREHCLEAWQAFFDHFPDYQNVFVALQAKDDVVIATGYSICSDKHLDGPAIWTARVRNGMIAEWRVYEDSLENRGMVGIGDCD
jgi:ketosteroid isomerase-like protein